MRFAIVGITGHTGSVLAEKLLAEKHQLRGVSRDSKKAAAWEAKGVRMSVHSLRDAAALTKDFAEADGAYLLLPTDITSSSVLRDQRELSDAMLTAVAASKLKHVVLLSSWGAHLADGTGPIVALKYLEEELRKLPNLATTTLRAAYFLENNASALAGVSQGAFPTFLDPEVAIPQVATRDLGSHAATLLTEGGRGHRILEITGPRDYSPRDLAAELSALVGTALNVQAAPEEAVVPAFTSFGFSQNMAELYRELIRGIRNGHVKFEQDTKQRVRGVTTAADVFRQILAANRP